jgi:heme exporter protein D
MSADFWLAIGVVLALAGLAVLVMHRLETKRARRLEEEGRQRRLRQELRSLSRLAPPLRRRNGGQTEP